MKLVLASASPRRRELLTNAGFRFVVRPANIEEQRLEAEPPVDYVRRLARDKAEATPSGEDEIVLAADTTVEIDGHSLEKPADAADAARMLRLLNGRVHLVHTGICLRFAARAIVDVATTEVSFLPLTETEIAEYVASGEPMDKAGAYGIQGLASRFAERINGCYFNVVGLPVSLVWRRLRELESSRFAVN